MITKKIRIHGQVQGVGFRYTIRQWAKELNITAEPVNQPDGNLEVLIEGDKEV